jgi:integral membrane protein (TIGR01906 family)
MSLAAAAGRPVVGGSLGFVRQFAALLFVIALPVALVTTNVRIAVNEPRVYEYATDHYSTDVTTGIERSELLRASGELRDYFNGDDDGPVFIRVRRQGELVSLFNRDETTHLQDVRSLFQTTFRVQEVAVIFVLAYVVLVFLWAREGTVRALASQVLASGVLSLVVIGVVGGIAMAGFDQAFEQFHVIAFDNDLWQLDPDTDHLIQMFPEAFWRDITVLVGFATLLEFGLLAMAATLYLSVTRPEEPSFALAEAAQA